MVELQSGRLAAASQHFDQAHTQDPTSPQAQAGVMWNAARSGDGEAAQRHEARALELDPDGWKTRQLLAMLWSQLGRPDRAWPLIEAALKLRPEQRDLHRDAVVTLVQLGRAEETARHLAVTGQPLASASFSNRLAIAHARAGDAQRALTLFETIVERHPGYAPAKRNLASLLQRINRP
jgi:Flp pilus assembly protein TadD